MKIKTRYERIQKNLTKSYDQLKLLQAECTHENKTMKYRGDTGNWDRSDDCYWIEHNCPDCGKHWTTPQ